MFLRRELLIVVFTLSGILTISYFEITPVKALMDWRSKRYALAQSKVGISNYEVYNLSDEMEPDLTVDFLKGKHFWNPQVAIWLEDSAGIHLETLLVTTSTAKGLFYSGRSANNFKESDGAKVKENTPTRRVDALPYWSHKHNRRYSDGFYSPPPDEPLPDPITCATPQGNFHLKAGSTTFRDLKSFRILVEVNVAFDENEFYSEYDFLDDSLYHSGTGLLGQPSIIYEAYIRKTDHDRYYVLSRSGHGHHSGSTGELFRDMSTVSTANYIVERIVVGVNENWYGD